MNTSSSLDTAVGRAEHIVSNPLLAQVIKIIGGVVVIILLLILSKIITGFVHRSFLKHSTENNVDGARKVAKLISSVVFYVLVLMTFFIGFEVMGFNIGLLVGGLSFGIGLAFKEILGNMFAGIMILYTKEFKIGDIIEVQTQNNYFGRIEEISIRYTVIRTLDLRQVIIPNITLITVPVKTFSSEEIVRLETTLGIHYDTDLTLAIHTLIDIINSLDFVQEKENTKVFVQEFSDNAVKLKCMFYFDPKHGILAQVALGQVNEKINEVFKQKGIVIPYNQVTLGFEQDTTAQKILQKNKNN